MHDAELRLYDAACELLAAAQLLRQTADDATAAAVIAPTLGCLQDGLQEVGLAVETLQANAPTGAAGPPLGLRGALDDLSAMLRLAARAADAARAAAAARAAQPRPGTGADGRPRLRRAGVTRVRRRP